MKNILSLTKKVTVEEIHAEFDSAQERIQCEAEKILNELSIPTETAIERKAKLAEELGFVKSEIVEKAKVFKERNNKIAKKLNVTRIQADTLAELRFNYPADKFLTTDELNRICEKYGLIHAPIKNYIKDIPEKNLLEIKNGKNLLALHKAPLYKTATYKVYDWASESRQKEYMLPRDVKKWEQNIVIPSHIKHRYQLSDFLKQKYNPSKDLSLESFSISIVDKGGLFIAAPKSHFNTDGLGKKSPFGFFSVQTVEVKDPVVFEYCMNDFIRIRTKWGTDDDQSFLDPLLLTNSSLKNKFAETE